MTDTSTDTQTDADAWLAALPDGHLAWTTGTQWNLTRASLPAESARIVRGPDGLVHAVWGPLVEATRKRHLKFRRRLAARSADGGVTPIRSETVLPAGV